MNRELERILSEDIFTIKNKDKIFIDTDTGLPNPKLLDYKKSTFVKESMEHLKNEIVVTNYVQPNKNGMLYELLLDCVIIKRKDFERIKAILDTNE